MQRLKKSVLWLREPQNLLPTLLALVPIYFVILYMETYGRNAPINDQWMYSFRVAIAARNGSLSLGLILKDFAGHRIFFTGALTAILTEFADWNNLYEMYVNLPLAVGEFIVLIALFRRQYPHLTPYILVPFSMLTFSLYQYLNWLSGFYTIWHFVTLFFLLALYTVERFKQGWMPFLAAGFFSLCATFSLGPGIVTWAAIGVALWLYGYRRWYYYAIWIASTLLTVYVYTREVAVGVAEEGATEGFASLRLDDPIGLVEFTLAFLGNPFTTVFDPVLGRRVGALGLVILTVNLVYLWSRRRQLTDIAMWLTMSVYALGVAFLTAITRYRADYPINALEQRYTIISHQMWIAIIAMAVIIVWQVRQQTERKNWHHALVAVNLIVVMLITGLYFRSNVWNLQTTANRYNHVLGYEFGLFELREETCLRNFPLTRDMTCVKDDLVVQLGNATDEQIYQLAVYRMATFAEQDPVYALPPSYDAGSPILIDTPSRWLNVYVRDWMLPGVPQTDLFHIAPPEVDYSTEVLKNPLGDNLVTFDAPDFAERLEDFVGDSEEVWAIFTPETVEQEDFMLGFMVERGYTPLFMPLLDRRYQDAAFKMVRYQRAPSDTEDLLIFANNISLQAWEVVTGTELAACDTLTLESWWLAEEVPDANYSATLLLADADGKKIVNVDGSPAGIEMMVWEPDLLYSDTRSLIIPCDLPPGDYSLQLALYDLDTFEELPITGGAEADPDTTRATLTSITVEAD
jgi:hypothetical protein